MEIGLLKTVTWPTSRPPTMYMRSWSWFRFSSRSLNSSISADSTRPPVETGRIFRPGSGVLEHESGLGLGKIPVLSGKSLLLRNRTEASFCVIEDSRTIALLGRTSPGRGGRGWPVFRFEFFRIWDNSTRSLLRRAWKSCWGKSEILCRVLNEIVSLTN